MKKRDTYVACYNVAEYNVIADESADRSSRRCAMAFPHDAVYRQTSINRWFDDNAYTEQQTVLQ